MIVPMKKAFLVCLKEEREALLRSLQQCGEIMLIPPEESQRIQMCIRDREEDR